MSLCFPFYCGIWDLGGSSRQDEEASETLWGGGGRSVCSPLQGGGSELPQLPWKFFIFSPAPAGACEASQEQKQDLRAGEGKTQTLAGLV